MYGSCRLLMFTLFGLLPFVQIPQAAQTPAALSEASLAMFLWAPSFSQLRCCCLYLFKAMGDSSNLQTHQCLAPYHDGQWSQGFWKPRDQDFQTAGANEGCQLHTSFQELCVATQLPRWLRNFLQFSQWWTRGHPDNHCTALTRNLSRVRKH